MSLEKKVPEGNTADTQRAVKTRQDVEDITAPSNPDVCAANKAQALEVLRRGVHEDVLRFLKEHPCKTLDYDDSEIMKRIEDHVISILHVRNGESLIKFMLFSGYQGKGELNGIEHARNFQILAARLLNKLELKDTDYTSTYWLFENFTMICEIIDLMKKQFNLEADLKVPSISKPLSKLLDFVLTIPDDPPRSNYVRKLIREVESRGMRFTDRPR